MTITAVVFDYGGVITGPPFVGAEAYEREAGLPPGTLTQIFRRDPEMARVETGELAARDYFKGLGVRIQEQHGVRMDLRRFAELIEGSVGTSPEMIELVRELHGRYRLGLLTNVIREATTWRTRLPLELFDVVIESHAVGLRKPDPRIYLAMLEAVGRPPDEVVFIDDFDENLPPATALGIHTILFESPEQCRRELAALGVH